MQHILRKLTVILAWAVGFILCGVVVLVVVLWFWHNQNVTLPAPTGKYAVGRLRYDWRAENRPEPLCVTPDGKRELAVWVWYPVAVDHTLQEFAPYLPTSWQIARQQGVLSAILTQDLATVQGHAITNAPLASEQPTYPLLLFQPGLGPLATDYTAILEDLASHGYIVVASTPTCSASVVVFDDGHIVEGTAQGNVPDDATLEEAKQKLGMLVQIWADDQQFVYKQLEILNHADPLRILTGRLDLQRIGVFGHSFGGAAALQFCSQDQHCKAGANLDGYPYGAIDQMIITQPFLFLWSDPSEPTDEGWQYAVNATHTIVNHAKADKTQFTIQGMQHFNFSDMSLYYSPVLKLTGGLGTIEGKRGIAITRAYLRTFFDHYSQGIDTPLLQENSAEYPEVRTWQAN